MRAAAADRQGKIIRVHQDVYDHIGRQRRPGQSMNDVIRRRLGLPKRTKWVRRDGDEDRIITKYPCCKTRAQFGAFKKQNLEFYERICNGCGAYWLIVRHGRRLQWSQTRKGGR